MAQTGLIAVGCQPGRKGYGVLFGDADVEATVGEYFFKLVESRYPTASRR